LERGDKNSNNLAVLPSNHTVPRVCTSRQKQCGVPDAERVVAGEVCALAHKVKAVFPRCQQLLGELARNLPVEPGHLGKR
jgi:hypothetical protein